MRFYYPKTTSRAFMRDHCISITGWSESEPLPSADLFHLGSMAGAVVVLSFIWLAGIGTEAGEEHFLVTAAA